MRSEYEGHRDAGRLFDGDAAAYDGGRPPYPERVYDLLVERAGLRPGARVVEIGAGTGQATVRLLDAGALVTAIEPGPALAARLRRRTAGRAVDVVEARFEDAPLPRAGADLVVAATSFHWLRPEVALPKVAATLRPGGWLARWWTVFGDPDRPDPFHDALTPLLRRLAPALVDPMPPAGAGAPAHPLDLAARTTEVAATPGLEPVLHEVVRWTGRHDAATIRRLFASFSPWRALADDHRERVLDALEDLARDRFGGVVERPYLTAVHLARREGAPAA